MRNRKDFSYVIEKTGTVPEIFNLIKNNAGISEREMYATFNMGAGFAVFVSPKHAGRVITISKKHKINAWIAGRVEKGLKSIHIKPLNISYNSVDLDIR